VTTPTVLILGGIALFAIGLAHMFSDSFVRKFIQRREFGINLLDLRFVSEKFAFGLSRFVIGPIFIVLAVALLMKGLRS
jgi:hypothetical protein